ncbi:MAG: redoxin domain-containing protein [Deltaproteobacteria bacterium]|nr:redoxin domain-containing protein [Deltaproteobacteria bacterium]
MAPDFELLDQNGKPVKLSDFRGQRNVVLAFYVLAFTSG